MTQAFQLTLHFFSEEFIQEDQLLGVKSVIELVLFLLSFLTHSFHSSVRC